MAIKKVYHGSDRIIKAPKFAHGSSERDFGVGFYCTEYPDMAREWACTYHIGGFLNEYEINIEYLYVLDFSSEEHSIMEWLALVLSNRKFRITDAKAERKCEDIIERYLPDTEAYDAIVGMRADDAHFALVKAFLNGDITEEKLKEIFDSQPSQNQIFFKNPKCFRILNYVNSTPIDESDYYCRYIRDERFRAFIAENDIKIREYEYTMGELIEYVAEACHEDVNEFFRMMEITGLLNAWDEGDSKIRYGMSGCEIAREVFRRSGKMEEGFPAPLVRMISGVGDWSGRLLCHVSAMRGVRVRDVIRRVSYEKLSSYYPKYYLDGIDEAAKELMEIFFADKDVSRLQSIRKERGISQRLLSERSGVNLRTLQQYEIKAKDINRASADKVIRLAAALNVSPDRLLEL